MKDSPKCSRCGASLPPDAPEGLCPRCLLALNLVTETDIAQGPHGTHVVKPPPEPPPPVDAIARLFPELEILESLGRGGMGLVYKARQRRLNRLVALKLLSRERMGDAQFADRFEREAQALASLNHPNIVAVYEFGQVDGNPFFIMEYVDGLNLRELEKAGKLSPRQAMQIIPQICEALQYAHDEGIVHRDIKPENILLDKKGRVKIADFGIAKILGRAAPDRNLTQASQVVGTPNYMAPEQVETPQSVDHRADIYSLGVVFYEMLTGELPLGKFQPPSRKVQIDVRLDDVVLHALEKEPERRYQHARHVKTDLETIATSKQEPASAQSASEGTPQITASRPSRSVGKLGWAGRIIGLLNFLFVLMFITAEGFPPFWNQPPAVQVELISMLVMLIGLLVGWKSPFWGAFWILDGWLTFAVAELRWPPVPFTIFLVVAALYAWTWWKTRRDSRPVLLQGQDAINEAEWRDPRNWTGPRWLSVYFSKRDTRTWVPKQIPSFGWTVNLGTPRGCAWLFGILLAITLFAATLPHWLPQAPARAATPPTPRSTNLSQSLTPIPPEAPALVDSIKNLGEQMARASQSNDVSARVQFEKEHSARMKELQDEFQLNIKLKEAEVELLAMEQRFAQGLVDIGEYQKARLNCDIAGAELRGDKVAVARLRLQFMEQELARYQERYNQGLVGKLELDRMKANRDIAAVTYSAELTSKLEELRTKYPDKHPLVEDLRNKLRQLQNTTNQTNR